ncbi:hypothetical protein GDO81_022482 [Engystomops pustulosus]|uniref:Uncharacterized protein n=1 Tax=Engystomops pustulosus TaxID=76066 RepID=A0AAV6YMS0_ENGPU|nr:hypothetical protein GDO81_022482 [Engystomops pustulosus]
MLGRGSWKAAGSNRPLGFTQTGSAIIQGDKSIPKEVRREIKDLEEPSSPYTKSSLTPPANWCIAKKKKTTALSAAHRNCADALAFHFFIFAIIFYYYYYLFL